MEGQNPSPLPTPATPHTGNHDQTRQHVCDLILKLRNSFTNQPRVVFALFIISKSGGLIYNREFHTGMSKLTSNDYLMLAGSFHGYMVHNIDLRAPISD